MAFRRERGRNNVTSPFALRVRQRIDAIDNTAIADEGVRGNAS